MRQVKKANRLMAALEVFLGAAHVPLGLKLWMMLEAGRLADYSHTTVGGITAGLQSAPLAGVYVSMQTVPQIQIVIELKPASGTASSTITLLQATDIENSPVTEKALGFTYAKYCNPTLNAANGVPLDTLVDLAVTGNQIVTSATAQEEMFIIDVMQTDLDINNLFTSIRANMTQATGGGVTPAVIIYTGYPDKYARGLTLPLRSDIA